MPTQTTPGNPPQGTQPYTIQDDPTSTEQGIIPSTRKAKPTGSKGTGQGHGRSQLDLTVSLNGQTHHSPRILESVATCEASANKLKQARR